MRPISRSMGGASPLVLKAVPSVSIALPAMNGWIAPRLLGQDNGDMPATETQLCQNSDNLLARIYAFPDQGGDEDYSAVMLIGIARPIQGTQPFKQVRGGLLGYPNISSR